MKHLDKMVIDSSGTISELCLLGTEHGTDKSPYNVGHHRHPYTAIYNLLFSSLRHQPIRFGELGILDNSSMRMWRSFFPNATLYGYEFDREKIAQAETDELARAIYGFADVTRRSSLREAFNRAHGAFDILIDDSTHQFEHQMTFIDVAIDFVKPGGMVIVEDVFRGWGDARYRASLEPFFSFFSSGTLIEANHDEAFSGGSVEPYFDNDMLLVLFRNDVPRHHHHPDRDTNLARLAGRASTD